MTKEGKSNVWDMLNQAEMSRLGRSTPQPPQPPMGPSAPMPPAQAPGNNPPLAGSQQSLPATPPPLPATPNSFPRTPNPLPTNPAGGTRPPAKITRPVDPNYRQPPPLKPAAQPPAWSPETSSAPLPSNQSNVMSASRFAQANSAHLDRMAAAARDWTEAERGSSDPVLAHLDTTTHRDRFVPSPEAVMDELVVSTELPRDSVRRHVDSVRNVRDAQAQRHNTFPGAADNGRRGELSRKLAVSLGVLCFVLAGGLLYVYFFSSFGPHRTNDAALQMSQELDRDAKLAQGVPEMGTISPLSSVDKPPEVAGQVTDNVPLPANVNPIKPGIKVHVAGAVNKPGLITLPFEARVDDAIKAAGGFSASADKESVNLASYVSDGDQVVVESRNAEGSGSLNLAVDDQRTKQRHVASGKKKQKAHKATGASSSAQVAAGDVAAGGESEIDASATKKQAKDNQKKSGSSDKKSSSSSGAVEFAKVNVNNANAIELLQLRGVGPQLAEAIIQYRNQLPQGRFTSVEQLQNIPGIGAGKFQDMRAQVQL